MGYYPVTMAMLNLLLRLIHGIGIAKDADTQAVSFLDLAACLVFVMREVFAGFHKWRFAAVKDREEIGAVLSFHFGIRSFRPKVDSPDVSSPGLKSIRPMCFCRSFKSRKRINVKKIVTAFVESKLNV